jgi:hypothetical protein
MILELKEWLTEMRSSWRFVVPFWLFLWSLASMPFVLDRYQPLLAALGGAVVVFVYTAVIALAECCQRIHFLDGRNDDG